MLMANLRTILANVCSVPHRQGDSGHPWADLTCVCAAEYSKFGLSLDIGAMGVEGSVPAPATDVTPTSSAAAALPPTPPPPPVTASAGRRLTAAPGRACCGASWLLSTLCVTSNGSLPGAQLWGEPPDTSTHSGLLKICHPF